MAVTPPGAMLPCSLSASSASRDYLARAGPLGSMKRRVARSASRQELDGGKKYDPEAGRTFGSQDHEVGERCHLGPGLRRQGRVTPNWGPLHADNVWEHL